MPDITVTLTMQQYDDLRDAVRAANTRAADLEKKLRETERVDPSGRVPALVEMIERVLPVVRFAVANLDPETIRNWPYQDLRTFGDLLEKLPGAEEDTKAVAREFRSFSRDAEKVEKMRAEGTHKQLEHMSRGGGTGILDDIQNQVPGGGVTGVPGGLSDH